MSSSKVDKCQAGDFALVVGTPPTGSFWIAEIISATTTYGRAVTIKNIHTGTIFDASDVGTIYIIHADQIKSTTFKATIKKTGKTFQSIESAKRFIKKFL